MLSFPEPYWVMLSAADFAGVQLFLIAGFYITRKINEVSTLECVKKTQKRNLWAVIFAFEVSAITGLVYDVTIKMGKSFSIHILETQITGCTISYSVIVGNEEVGCSGIFAHTQLIYSPVFFMFMIFKFCLPIWSLLAVLEPLPTGISYSEILATSHSGVIPYKIYNHSLLCNTLRKNVLFNNRACLGHVEAILSVRPIASYEATSLMTMQIFWVLPAVLHVVVAVVCPLIRIIQNSPHGICSVVG